MCDVESEAYAASLRLRATCAVERELDDTRSVLRQQLHVRERVTADLQQQLDQESDFFQTTQAQLDKTDARRTAAVQTRDLAADALARDQTLLQRQEVRLADQLGLLEAAATFPADLALQKWTLALCVAMTRDPTQRKYHTLFLHENIVATVHNALQMFPFARQLQLDCLTCMAQLCMALRK